MISCSFEYNHKFFVMSFDLSLFPFAFFEWVKQRCWGDYRIQEWEYAIFGPYQFVYAWQFLNESFSMTSDENIDVRSLFIFCIDQ